MSYDALTAELLEATQAGRTTLRLDTPGAIFPVVAEACAPGVRSIRDATEIDLRTAETFRYLERERRLLVQGDCLTDGPEVPTALIEAYGVRAQMLAPIVVDNALAGIVSVHHLSTPRAWTEEEIAALEDAAERVRLTL